MQLSQQSAKVSIFETAFETFPLTLFSGIQSFGIYQNLTDFLGGALEFPITLLQYPYYLATGSGFSLPNRDSEIQAALNLGRFRSIHADVI